MLMNFLAMYYMIAFCNVYIKSSHAMMESVYLTVFLDIIAFEIAAQVLIAGVRSILRLFITGMKTASLQRWKV